MPDRPLLLITKSGAGDSKAEKPFELFRQWNWLLDGSLPHRWVGRHQRIRMEKVMDYKVRIDYDREAVLRLAAQPGTMTWAMAVHVLGPLHTGRMLGLLWNTFADVLKWYYVIAAKPLGIV